MAMRLGETDVLLALLDRGLATAEQLSFLVVRTRAETERCIQALVELGLVAPITVVAETAIPTGIYRLTDDGRKALAED
jgi:predicted transcriptional regulator